MNITRYLVLLTSALALHFLASGQRIYAPHSVLNSGTWYKISVGKPGIYKIDIPFLNTLGVNTSSISSASVRLFGNGGQMLAEANSGPWMDDLVENAIQVVDGGDGLLNGSDHILFYSNGPDEWTKDSANSRFIHRKNVFSDKAFYFLTIGGPGKRVANSPLAGSAVTTVNSFSERYFHELDTVNFLAGSKEWYGEELSALPGRSLTRNFNIDLPNLVNNAPLLLQANCAARSVAMVSRFDIRINNQTAGQLPVNSISGNQYDLFAQQATGLVAGNAPQNNVDIGFTYVPGSFNAQGWINWFELFTRRTISLNGVDQLLFRDWSSVNTGNAEFVVSAANGATQVWEITNPLEPSRMQGTLAGTELRFVNNCVRLREYVAFNPANLFAPLPIGKINNQDLHAAAATDMLIVTHPVLLSQAQRLAGLHQQQNSLRVTVITTEQVYNEFGSGSPDPTSIRDFAKMYHDKFAASTANKLKYLLLFGDASFDYKDRINGNTNLVPAYENNFALDPLSSYASDDFFGFLDNNEDINSGLVVNLLDIGIGRVPAKNLEEATNFVNKVEGYFSAQALGPWRNTLTFVADDEDNNLHLQDAEIITTTAAANNLFNQQKIYLDAYKQEGGAGGTTYPQAIQASNNQVYNGTLIWNYNGHGGSRRLAEETILDQDMVNNWNNSNRLPLFITATCDFAPYDNPTVNSIGENILMRAKTGAIGLMTTTRVVFAFSNRIMNNNYLQFALQPDINGNYRTLGEAVMAAKNFTYQNSGDITNNRKFTLLGDPALKLAFPVMRASATKVNGIPVANADTLSATEKITIEGEITDIAGNRLANFNGNVYPTVFDKPQTITTLANDPGSQVTHFSSQTNALFKGKASVTNGQFSFSFKVPRDINYQFGNGRLSLYAENGTTDANGVFSNFIIGGAGSGGGMDNEGPEIKPFLNDELFANGGITNQNPVLIVKLADSSGINTVGTGIGHDIIATLDNDNRQYYVLNDFYQGDLNSYQQGAVRFQLPELEAGSHSLKIKAWDVLNNSSEVVLEFTVAKDEELELSHVLNYPNPFTTHTNFWFEHNKPGQPLEVQLQIMTITGRTVKTFSRVITTEGNRSAEIEWDGKDDHGDKLGRGVYLYRLRVTAPGKNLPGRQAGKKEVIEKLVIL